MLNFLQKIGKALMLPIAVLPAAALLLGFGNRIYLILPLLPQLERRYSITLRYCSPWELRLDYPKMEVVLRHYQALLDTLY